MKLAKGISIAVIGLMMVSCKGKNKAAEQDQTPNVPTVRAEGLKIAFYEQDSLTKHFTYYVEMDSLMKSKQLAFQKEYQRRESAYYQYVSTYNEKAKAGSLSAFDLQNIEKEAQRKQQSLIEYQQTEGEKLEKETVELLGVIGKKIEEAGKEYSKKHGLDLLMMHGAGGQFVYVNPSMDVTKEFIAYLNEYQAKIDADMGKKQK